MFVVDRVNLKKGKFVESQINQHLKSIQALGFCYASFGFHNALNQEITACFSHKNWGNLYVSEGLYRFDPLLQLACQVSHAPTVRPILWSALSSNSEIGHQVMIKRESLSGARFGMTLAINAGQFQEIIAIGDQDKEDIFMDRFKNHHGKIMQVRDSLKSLLVDC